MYVCLCHGISDRRIRDLVEQGCSTVKDIQQSCNAGKNCGACVGQLRELAQERQNGVPPLRVPTPNPKS